MYNADTTPKAPRQCTYIGNYLDNERQNRPKPMKVVYNTPHEAFPLLCSWLAVESLRSSYTVKTKAYSYALYVYMSAQPLPIGASGMGIDVTKIMNLYEIQVENLYFIPEKALLLTSICI